MINSDNEQLDKLGKSFKNKILKKETIKTDDSLSQESRLVQDSDFLRIQSKEENEQHTNN